MLNGQLKLLGVVIDKGCAPHLKKNLKTGVIYPFYRTFKDFHEGNPLAFVDTTLPEDFYTSIGLSTKVSISAIVGPNGSGKSGLIDIVLRIVNNAACRLVEQYDYSNHLVFVKGLRATLYYSIGYDLFCLVQNGDLLTQIKLYRYIDGRRREIPINKKYFSNYFFYSILLNYSIHAFNTNDYKDEFMEDMQPLGTDAGCWIKGVFHKNDGYLAPLVLNPKRTKGNIDINIENHLAKSRLMSLSFLDDGRPNTSYVRINDRYNICSIDIRLDTSSVNRKYNEIFGWWKNNNSDYDDTMEPFMRDCIIKSWSTRYKFKKADTSDSTYATALNYLVYKTISIATKYDAFDNFQALSPYYKEMNYTEWAADIDKLIAEIDREVSHITFRLRQIIAFLIFRQYEATDYVSQNIRIEEFATIPQRYKIGKEWEISDIVPPPCFATEIKVKDKLTGDEFPFTHLSSGERQLSYVSSTILYHLRNLNSVKRSIRRAKYRHINVILDEIELYFHPDYQKDFVLHLLECLKSVRLGDMISINFIMITHSPFILSDIPKSNVLFLKDGQPNYDMQENTFAANIHGILQNGFFLENGTIGNFARMKVNDMFGRLHEAETDDKLKQEILLVSEPILRSQLLKIYNELTGREERRQIAILRHELEALKLEIRLLKDDKD